MHRQNWAQLPLYSKYAKVRHQRRLHAFHQGRVQYTGPGSPDRISMGSHYEPVTLPLDFRPSLGCLKELPRDPILSVWLSGPAYPVALKIASEG